MTFQGHSCPSIMIICIQPRAVAGADAGMARHVFLKSSDDQVTTNPVAINDIFKGFYTNLYKAETDFDEPICKQFLDKLELPQISQMDKESLEAPLSLEELHVSLKSLQKGKSPGLDGLPPESYLEIWDLVGILMLNSFNFAIEHGVFHRDQKTSLISLLLKKGKDPLDCSSYRPISLIPYDLKFYAKVFASRMEKVIHSLIKEDQTSFIQGCNHLTICVDSFIFLTLQILIRAIVRFFHLMQKKPLTG